MKFIYSKSKNVYDYLCMKHDTRINVIVNIIRTLVLTLLSFITFPWVCRYLGDSMVGAYTWANTFVAYFLILAKIGIPNLAVRECVKVRDDKEKLSNKAQGFFLLQLISTMISFALMCAVVFSVPAIRDSSALIFILSINFIVGAFSFEWIFIALEKQFYMSVRSIVALTLCAILVIVFVTTPSDVYIYALVTASVTVLTAIANIFYVRKFISFKKTMPYSFKEYVRPLFVLCSLSLIISLYNQTDTFILGFISNEKAQAATDAVAIKGAREVANYSVGIKGIDIIIGIFANLSTVFIPRAAYYYQQEDKKYFNNLTKYSMNICFFIVLPAIVTMAILSRPICSLISGNFDYSTANGSYQSAPIVLITLCSMMLTYSLGEIIYGQILLPMKKEKYYLIAIGGGTLLNIGLSILFGAVLPKYISWMTPAIGVAIGTATTDLIIIIFLISLTWKWVKNAIFNLNTLKLVIASLIILGISLGLYKPFEMLWGNLKISQSAAAILQMVSIVFIDAIVYLLFLGLTKEKLVYSFLKKKPAEVQQ